MKWWKKALISTSIGATIGYAYYHFFGCITGSCPITSNPWTSIFLGAFTGFWLVSSPCARGQCEVDYSKNNEKEKLVTNKE